MFEFISESSIVDFATLLSLIFLGVHAFRAFARLLTFGIEAIMEFVQTVKSANLKAIATAAMQLVTKTFDAAAPAVVLLSGASVIAMNFAMLAFVPNLGLFEVLSTEFVAVAIVWRSLEAYLQHVERARGKLTLAPKKKG